MPTELSPRTAPWLVMLTPQVVVQLQANYREQLPHKGRNEVDFRPVCKLFLPWTSGTWLLTELDNDGLAFGLADMGYPELGYVSLDELWAVRGPGGLTVEQDIHFEADKTLSAYAEEARIAGRITA